MKRLVIIESPYAGEVEANVAYARAAMRDSLSRGEAPIASHLLYTQPGVLDDGIPEERQLGIDAGLQWARVAECAVFYVDRGWSPGMQFAHFQFRANDFPTEVRTIEGLEDPGAGGVSQEAMNMPAVHENDLLEKCARAIAVGCGLDPNAISPKAAAAGHQIPEWRFFVPAANAALTAVMPAAFDMAAEVEPLRTLSWSGPDGFEREHAKTKAKIAIRALKGAWQ